MTKRKKRKLHSCLKKRIKNRDNHTCYICGKKSLANITVDHIYPESRGGTDEDCNLAACCHECNQIKKDMTATELVLKIFADATADARQIGLEIDLFSAGRV